MLGTGALATSIPTVPPTCGSIITVKLLKRNPTQICGSESDLGVKFYKFSSEFALMPGLGHTNGSGGC